MEYKDIDRVNGEIAMIDLKGKNYAMVPERVTAFRKLYPEGFIRTEIISNDGTTVLMQTKAGYYTADGREIVLGTGMAQEVRGKGMVNGTSHIENCETSAIGRALGMIGLGINGGGICSAEELVNAITAQNQMRHESPKAEPLPEIRQDVQAAVTTAEAVPAVPAPAPQKKAVTPVQQYIAASIATMKKEIPGFNFQKMRKQLIDENLIYDIPSEKMSMDEAAQMLDVFYQRFRK